MDQPPKLGSQLPNLGPKGSNLEVVTFADKAGRFDLFCLSFQFCVEVADLGSLPSNQLDQVLK